MKKQSNVSNKRKTVTVDITEFYDELRKMSEDDIRTIEEEVRYLLKTGIRGNCKAPSGFTVTYGYDNNSVIDSSKNFRQVINESSADGCDCVIESN